MLEAKLLTIDPRTVRKADLKLESQEIMQSVIANDRQGLTYMGLHSSVNLTYRFISRLDDLQFEGTYREKAEKVADYMSNKEGANIVAGVSVRISNPNSKIYYGSDDLGLWQQINPSIVISNY